MPGPGLGLGPGLVMYSGLVTRPGLVARLGLVRHPGLVARLGAPASWFLRNVARNSPACVSNFEI